MLLFYTEQRWSDGNDSQAATEMSRKGRRRSDVSEDIIDENAGTYVFDLYFLPKISWIQSHVKIIKIIYVLVT